MAGHLIIDEIGREENAKHFGTSCNVIQTILQMRYELRHEMLTFGTTNIDMEDLSQFRNLYGDYVLDRVKEMFNIVHLGGNSVVNGYKMEKELEKLQRQLAMAIKERRYARMAELQRKIAALQNVREHVPLSFLLPKFTPQERDKALVLMHQVFVFADMLYGAALEFEEYLKGFDRSVTLPVVSGRRRLRQSAGT